MAQERKKGEPSEKNTPIDLKDKVTVYSTDKDPHHETGAEVKLHPNQVERAVKAGLVTREKQAPKSKPEEPPKK